MYSARKYYSEALMILAQTIDPQKEGPEVIIEPMEPIIQKAVNLLKKMDPNIFRGVKKVVITPSSSYGFVESGKDKDPSVIHINFQRIKQELSGKSPEEIVSAVAEVIAHERGHVHSYDEQKGFVGGESPAEAEERKALDWIKRNPQTNI